MQQDFTPEQRRRMAALSDEIDREVGADRRFFERMPERSYRVRKAFPAERKHSAIAVGVPPKGSHLFVAVRQIGPGVRLRAFFSGPPDLETDLADDTAEEVYAWVSRNDQRTRQVELALSAALEKRG